MDVGGGDVTWRGRLGGGGLRGGEVEGVEAAGDEEATGGDRGELKETATRQECDGHSAL